MGQLRSKKAGTLGALVIALGALVLSSPGWASTCGVIDPSVGLVPIAETHITPPYPPISQRLGEEGVTVLRVALGSDGSVLNASLFRSSGAARLDQAALSYVKQNWRWQPPHSDCRPVAAVTDVMIAWNLHRDRDQTDGNDTPSLPPLSPSFGSMTPEQKKLMLADRLLSEFHLSESGQKILDISWAPVEAQFKDGLSSLPEPQQKLATMAFEDALDDAFSARMSKVYATLEKNYADTLDLDSLQALVALYATPLGQKSVVSPSTLTLQERQELGAVAVAHPGSMEAFVTAMRTFATSVKTMQDDRIAFAQDFRSRLCAKLAAVNIRHTMCSEPK